MPKPGTSSVVRAESRPTTASFLPHTQAPGYRGPAARKALEDLAGKGQYRRLHSAHKRYVRKLSDEKGLLLGEPVRPTVTLLAQAGEMKLARRALGRAASAPPVNWATAKTFWWILPVK